MHSNTVSIVMLNRQLSYLVDKLFRFEGLRKITIINMYSVL
jgi:hypothetical protein